MSETAQPAVPSPSGPTVLAVYLNDHLAGAAGGVRLARRLVRAHHGTDLVPDLVDIAAQIDADRDALVSLMGALGVRRTRTKRVLVSIGERVSRLKPNGALVRRSPLSSVLELETLRIGVLGKACGWRSLREVAPRYRVLSTAQLDELLHRAEEQGRRLDLLRVRAVRQAFDPGRGENS